MSVVVGEDTRKEWVRVGGQTNLLTDRPTCYELLTSTAYDSLNGCRQRVNKKELLPRHSIKFIQVDLKQRTYNNRLNINKIKKKLAGVSHLQGVLSD